MSPQNATFQLMIPDIWSGSTEAHGRRHGYIRTLDRVAWATVLFCLTSGAFAQTSSSNSLTASNAFVGYSFLGANLYTGQHANLSGWNVSAEKKYLPFFGVVADFSGHYGSKDLLPNGCAGSAQAQCLIPSSVSEHYFQAGVRGSYATARLRPFAEFLIGAVHTTESGTGLSNSKTVLEETLAFGIDYRLTHRLGWRLDGGWVETGSFTTRQNSVRGSTGLVVRF
jgi:hypothetical protein